MSSRGAIVVCGARQHNLRGFDVRIPHGTFTVITGPSGSGKSSLAFDTLYAEGQRRYVETFSPYTRQFLERMDKPRVDSIEGIPPAIAIEQGNAVRTSRSTVGTMTETADYLKLLYPRMARLICPCCSREVRPRTAADIAQELLKECGGAEMLVTFDVSFLTSTGGVPLAQAVEFVRAQGYLRALWNGKVTRLEELLEKEESAEQIVENLTLVQDRCRADKAGHTRLAEAFETALRLGKGEACARLISPSKEGKKGETEPEVRRYHARWRCAYDGTEFRAPTAGMFSFNNPTGACPHCRGFGRCIEIDYDLALPDRTRSIRAGVVKPWQSGLSQECQTDLVKACKKRGIPLEVPFQKLTQEQQDFVINGELKEKLPDEIAGSRTWYGVKGFFRWLETKTYKMHVRVFLSRYRAYRRCAVCEGSRFQPDVLAFKLGPERYSIAEISALPVAQTLAYFEQLSLPADDDAAGLLRREIVSRLKYLDEVGLGYLTLDRSTRTLSGGEIQRVNLTGCLGASLVNTLFVLDEPSIGLHPRDTDRLVRTMKRLRNSGNTVVVVEHDERVIRSADRLIDIGPGRGAQGGQLLFNGSPEKIESHKTSLTGAYLSGRKSIPLPLKRRDLSQTPRLSVRGAKENNLRNLDLDLPLHGLVLFTGVSGSGKSTLVHDILYKNILRARGQAVEEPGACEDILGHEQVAQVVLVDQTPLSRTPRSNPALYAGVYDNLRELFASSDEARSQGLNASSFSFNSGTGRCERCNGTGHELVQMQFLSDLYVKCPACEGRRFQPHVLEAKVKDRSIADVLDMSVDEAIDYLEPLQKEAATTRLQSSLSGARSSLKLLSDVGLGYIKLGQPLSQLSGGESQRIKLVGHLTAGSSTFGVEEGEEGAEAEKKPKARRGRKPAHASDGPPPRGDLLILDEPTTGLHFDDIKCLIGVLQRLVDAGHSLFVIEHNLDVIKCADWIVELGPEAGAEGGTLVVQGAPEEVALHPGSVTATFLRDALALDLPGGYALAQKQRDAKVQADGGARDEEGAHLAHSIEVRGARHHNLKDLSVDIPLNATTVVTGLSGSGKSTLAFDIIFAEGQRRYLDSLNTYARQFVQQLEKPDVDIVRNIPPTVAIEQQTTRGGGKSTVATVTEIHHFIRLLFAKLGQQHDPKTGEKAIRQSTADIQKRLGEQLKLVPGRVGLHLLAPLVKARKGFHTEVAEWTRKRGYQLLRVDGKWVEPTAFKALERYREHTIEVLIGDVTADQKTGDRAKIVSDALHWGRGTLLAVDGSNHDTVYSTHLYCPGTGRSFEELDPRLFSYNSPHGRCSNCEGFGTVIDIKLDGETAAEREAEAELKRERSEEGEEKICPVCHGERLNDIARAVRFAETSMGEVGRMSIGEAKEFFMKLKLKGREAEIARDILPEIVQRLTFLEHVGLGYLQLGRSARTLSGGESQRIRLAAQLGSNLEGVLYVLDEPTIGLHPRDNEQLLDILDQLKKRGNSLLIVEHDEETMRRADYVVDLGPGAGVHGGNIVAQGPWKDIAKHTKSITGLLLGEPLLHPMRGSRRALPEKGSTDWLQVKGCRANNLHDVDLKLPAGRLVVITGVSGSGKSTLMREVLLPAVRETVEAAKRRGRAPKTRTGLHKSWSAVENLDGFAGVVEVDQTPIGKTTRSTPATYTGIFDHIRAAFAQTQEARIRGYETGRFSFNTPGGRCEECQGHGAQKVEMAFLPTMWVHCEACGGSRYNRETLEARLHERNIGEVLQMSVEEAALYFKAYPRIARTLDLLNETGLGYLTLGQSSPTLSGGEAQRIKLVTELARGGAGRWLYLLEEPTIGLHLADVKRLIDVMHRLVESGHTVVVIEHHLDVIAEADYIVDVGPEGGTGGGRIIASGTPDEVAQSKTSHTARFLKEVLDRGTQKSSAVKPSAKAQKPVSPKKNGASTNAKVVKSVKQKLVAKK